MAGGAVVSVPATAWQRLETLFHQACRLPADEREAFARTQAGPDGVLRDQLLAMLAVEAHATLRLRAPLRQAAAALQAPLPELPVGTRFGAWAIDRLLGAGGMGQVYLGHRADGAYEREVAIKLVAADALDAQGRALFEFECRLLAQMVHPAIAQIHDVGSDDQGRPYLVMEYLRGEPITWWCDAHRLSLQARVLLMLRVGEAVQHAHQKGVIHRDLKPSNVLVSEIDGRPMPGVIDFGIAIDAANPGATTAQARGTPGYMSPEQARGAQDVDARSDIYALGAMLHELSCGLAPVAGSDGLPQPPSQRVAAVPADARARIVAARATSATRLQRQLRDGLDAIVLRAMAPQPVARYASVSALMDDLHRWRDGHPPRALQAGGWLRLRKFTQRHRNGVLAGALVAIASMVGLGATVWSLQQAARDAQRAQVTGEFMGSVLSSVDPAVAQALDKTLMRRVLQQASWRAAGELADQPQARTQIELTLGRSLIALADYAQAVAHLRTAQVLARQSDGADSLPALRASAMLGQALAGAGQPDQAERVLRQGIAQAARGDALQQALGNELRARLAWVLREQGRMGEAMTQSRQAYVAGLANPASTADQRIDAGTVYAGMLAESGQLPPAIALQRSLLRERIALHGAAHPLALSMRNTLAQWLLMQHDFAGAETELTALLQITDTLYGDTAADTLMAQANLAGALRQQGKLAQAGPHYRAALERARVAFGEDAPATITYRSHHADWLHAVGRVAEALAEQRMALASSLRVLGRAHPQTAEILRGMADAEQALGRSADARAHALQAAQILAGMHGAGAASLPAARPVLALSASAEPVPPGTASERVAAPR
ncbi:protein kinase domain-containing protein [Xanthomonas cucurbitae]|uniref:Serine/threonine-protein kinase n=1 Tax=Xanthomonas cucurbitae TaxID=56453 RepID=A0ABY7YBT9_9XANT|nr:serine/threonine-protein kinase [Xanthomonas cucurbitae]WDM71339.1 serine/threonine-protein kinase [Xanthomonas cucurbitae]